MLGATAVGLRASLSLTSLRGDRFTVQNTGNRTCYLGDGATVADVEGWHELDPGEVSRIGAYTDWWLRCPGNGKVVISAAASFEFQT